MDEIQITLNGGDALALLPLIDEAAEAQAGPEHRALWDFTERSRTPLTRDSSTSSQSSGGGAVI